MIELERREKENRTGVYSSFSSRVGNIRCLRIFTVLVHKVIWERKERLERGVNDQVIYYTYDEIADLD